MIQTRPYEFMVSYTPQRQWIERGGIKLLLAFFFIELGAGMFLVASLFNNLRAMAAGWFLCAILGGGFHLAYLGKPLRFWRMLFSGGWKTSWISRGLIFVILFLALGLVHMALIQSGARVTVLLALTDLFAFLTVVYGGFAMSFINGIPLWNTALLPILYVISGLLGGAEVTFGIALGSGEIGVGMAMEAWIRLLLIGFILLIPIYLISVRSTSSTGQASVKYMALGQWAPLFWTAVVIMGMIIPFVAVVDSFLNGLETGVVTFLYLAILSGLIGDLAMRYLILRGGMYSPLIPSSGSAV